MALSTRSLARLIAVMAAVGLSATQAMFRFDCFNNLVVDRADPITNFGKASGHLHAVSGGNGFSLTADGDAMLNSTCTSCPIGADKSAYWVPQMYVRFKNGTGFGLVESHQIVYYEPRPMNGEKVIAFPPGLKMLAGNPKLRSGNDDIKQRAITWVCLDYNNPHPEQQGIPNFKCPHGLRGQVNFPMCWNGKDLDSPDHQSHVAYAEGLDGGACPKGYQKMVKIFFEAFYSVDKYDDEWVDGKHPFVLSNGDPTGFGFHGDFLNGWDHQVLQDAIDQCSDKNYFNSGECPPLKATFSDKPPAVRCTTKPQVIEAIDNIKQLPGNNPVTMSEIPVTPETGNDVDNTDDSPVATRPGAIEPNSTSVSPSSSTSTTLPSTKPTPPTGTTPTPTTQKPVVPVPTPTCKVKHN